jgi:hypothetical protein
MRITIRYDNLLKKAKVPSLQIRRMRTMALETFKIMNKLSPSCLHNLVHLKNSKYYFRFFIQTCLIFCFIMSCCMQMPVATQRGIATWSLASIYMQYAQYGKNTFRFAAPTLWNSLPVPDHFGTENSFSQFKSLLQSWNGSKCHCSACRWLKFCFWFAYIFLFFIFFNYYFFLVWLENFIFFDILVRQCCFYWLLVPVLSIQYYYFFFLPAASFLNAA